MKNFKRKIENDLSICRAKREKNKKRKKEFFFSVQKKKKEK